MGKPSNVIAVLGHGGGSNRPQPRQQLPLTPWDPSDGDGNVYHDLPPEQNVLDLDPAFMFGDFGCVTLSGNYFPTESAAIIANGGTTMIDGPWKGLFIPFLSEACTTPPTVIPTPMLIRYPRDVQDAVLTEHCWRGYRDFTVSPFPWGDSRDWPPSEILAWCRYVMSWGFRIVLWYGGHPPDNGPDARLLPLFEGGVVGYYIHGKEVDLQYGTDADAYTRSVMNMDAYVNGRVPCGCHFSANGDREMSYPIGLNRELYMRDWSIVDGRWHLMLQSCGHLGSTLTSAGRQASSAGYYARERVNLGGIGGTGKLALKSRTVNFECMADATFFGYCDETTAVRRSFELFCVPRNDARLLPIAGSGNGLWYGDGSPIIRP
jgi:hypothetical protein